MSILTTNLRSAIAAALIGTLASGANACSSHEAYRSRIAAASDCGNGHLSIALMTMPRTAFDRLLKALAGEP